MGLGRAEAEGGLLGFAASSGLGRRGRCRGGVGGCRAGGCWIYGNIIWEYIPRGIEEEEEGGWELGAIEVN